MEWTSLHNQENKLKIICISDTHKQESKLKIPEGDVLVHAGDIGCERDSYIALAHLNYWMKDLPHKHKIVIPGNHDEWIQKNQDYAKKEFTSGHLLIDNELVIEGLKFYGSPWQPEFYDWAWNLPRGKPLQYVWSKIPDDTDVLITHAPPMFILDQNNQAEICGCWDLAQRISVVKPKLHVFGHIHPGYGIYKTKDTIHVNASVCNDRHKVINKPIVIEI